MRIGNSNIAFGDVYNVNVNSNILRQTIFEEVENTKNAQIEPTMDNNRFTILTGQTIKDKKLFNNILSKAYSKCCELQSYEQLEKVVNAEKVVDHFFDTRAKKLDFTL